LLTVNDLFLLLIGNGSVHSRPHVMAAEKGRTFVTQSISFHPNLLARAKDRAERLGLPFSTYVQKCIERDLVSRDPIVFEEKDSSADLMVAEDAASSQRSRSRSGGGRSR